MNVWQQAAETLNLIEYLDRYPRQLSGGQRQRVAMGRCIVRDPQVFLFDEPLSNLDAKLRVQMRTEIRELHQRLNATSIYVTHDQIEAMTMADHIVVMRAGNVEQIGAPLDVYDHPNNTFVAGFIGSPAMNLIEGTVDATNSGRYIRTQDRIELPLTEQQHGEPGQQVYYGIRPEHLELSDASEGIAAQVIVVEPTGSETLVVAQIGQAEIQAVFRERHPFKPGQTIHLRPNPQMLHIFDFGSEQRLH